MVLMVSAGSVNSSGDTQVIVLDISGDADVNFGGSTLDVALDTDLVGTGNNMAAAPLCWYAQSGGESFTVLLVGGAFGGGFDDNVDRSSGQVKLRALIVDDKAVDGFTLGIGGLDGEVKDDVGLVVNANGSVNSSGDTQVIVLDISGDADVNFGGCPWNAALTFKKKY